MFASGSESDHTDTPPTISPTLKPVPLGPNDEKAQREWEHWQVQRGIERYRRSLVRETKQGALVERGLDEVHHGQRIAADLIGPMVAAVKARQAEFLSSLNDPNLKRLPDSTTVITMLPAKTLAACAVLTALANPVEAGWTSVRIGCAARIRHELEYQEWQRAEREAEKQRKESEADGINLFKLMLHRNNGEIDKRVFDKWSKKSSTLVKIEWDQRTKVLVGGEVMALLIESNGWFEISEKREEGQKFPRQYFGMTESALALTKQLKETCELQRPFLAPMICEPADYVLQS
jgi:hypothetical protein